MSNVKKCGVVGIHMLDMFARLCARNQMTDASVEVYCRHSPIIGYTRSVRQSEKNERAVKKRTSEKRRKERRGEPVSIFSNTSIRADYPLPPPPNHHIVKNSSFLQNVKRQKVWCSRDSHARHVC